VNAAAVASGRAMCDARTATFAYHVRANAAAASALQTRCARISHKSTCTKAPLMVSARLNGGYVFSSLGRDTDRALHRDVRRNNTPQGGVVLPKGLCAEVA
jgi:hypothetical protein